MKQYKHAIFAVAIILGVSVVTFGVAQAVVSAPTQADCIDTPGVDVTCTVVIPYPIASTETVTATQTVTATATVTASPSQSPSSTPTPTPTVTPTPSQTPSPTPTPTVPPGACASSTPNVPDGPDGKGGCFPGVSNTGPNAPAASMATYTGSCNITAANVVIDSRVVNCDLRLASGASGFVLRNSYLFGSVSQSSGSPSFTIQDTLIDGGIPKPACSNGACAAGRYACSDCGVDGRNFTILRTEVINTNRAAWCNSCTIQDSYFHGTNLWPDPSNKQHASGMRMDQNGTIRHNSLSCSYVGPFYNGDPGCSADLSGYPDFAPVHHNTLDGNLFVASPKSGFCAYGGATAGKPYSGNAANATYIVFRDNVFMRGANRRCGDFGPVTSFASGRVGNVWAGNVWDDGAPVVAAN